MPHWLLAVLNWHRANVLGNLVASLEMGAMLLLAARPILRRIRRAMREHIAEQMGEHVGPLHQRFDELAGHLLHADNPADEPDDDSSPCPGNDLGL